MAPEPTPISEAPPPPAAEEDSVTTIGESFAATCELIARAKRETRLNEPTLVKLWELTLLWAVNAAPSGRAFDPTLITDTENTDDQ